MSLHAQSFWIVLVVVPTLLAACKEGDGGSGEGGAPEELLGGVIGVDGGTGGASGNAAGGATTGVTPVGEGAGESSGQGTAGGSASGTSSGSGSAGGPANQAPTITLNLGALTQFGATSVVITAARLAASDPEGEDVTFTVTTLPARGTLRRNGTALTTNGTFTQSDLVANLVTYDHGNTGTGLEDSFAFSFADPHGAGATGQTFALDVNESPALTRSGPLYYHDGGTSLQVPTNYFAAADADGDPITFTLTTAPAGTLRKNGTALAQGDTFTQSDLAQDKITYDHVAASGNDAFAVSLADGRGGTLAATSIAINVSGVDPALALGTPLVYAVGRAASPIASAATLTDADSANFAGGRLRAAITANAAAGDQLTILAEGTGAGQINVDTMIVSYEGTPIGTIVQTSPLVVDLNAAATPAATQRLVRRLGFGHADALAAALADRTVTVLLLDGTGGVTQQATTVDVRGLRAHWRFDDASGTTSALDSVAGVANAPLTGHTTPANDLDPATAWNPTGGKLGGALLFNRAETEFLDTGYSLKTVESFTLSAWVQVASATGGQVALWQGDTGGNGWGSAQHEVHIGLNKYTSGNDGHATFFFGNNENGAIVLRRTGMTFNVGAWHHLVATISYDSGTGVSTGAAYVDGVAMTVDTTANANARTDTTQNTRTSWRDALRIGAPDAGNVRSADGLIDDVRVYDYPLTQAEAQALFDAAD